MNLRYFIALNHIPSIGPRTVSKLLRRWPNLEEMFALPAKALAESGLPETLAQLIANFDLNVIDEDLTWSTNKQHHLLSWESPLYPSILKEIYDPPIILYAKGDLTAFDNPKLAIVGTRKPTVTGRENAHYFAKNLAKASVTIVSGLALGIDAAAHLGCLEANGKTIAVMGTGLDCIYPRRHQDLAAKITENGLLISEFTRKSPPIAGHFPRRNRIISGLSLSTLIIEAAIRSGSLITARFALEQNRDVLAIPGSIHNPQARGCHYLLQQGAKLVTSIEDIFETLQIEASAPPISTLTCAKVEQGLMQWIGFETVTVDKLMVRSQAKIEEIMGELGNLELQGLVKAVPGGYIRC